MKNFKKLRKITFKMGLALTVTCSTGAGLLAAPVSTFAATATSTSIADNVISTAKQYMGVPYHFGARTGNTSSFDCSSFTQYVFQRNGISIPRNSRQQSQVGTYVSRAQLQPGDLVFFYSPIHHVAIYIGNGEIIHTWGAGGVRIDSLNSNWWSSHYATSRRVIPNNGQATTSASQTQPAQTPVASNTAKYTKPIDSKLVLKKHHHFFHYLSKRHHRDHDVDEI